ncbi:MAG: hydroxymethylbilane synthase [Herpetosiphon sp.]
MTGVLRVGTRGSALAIAQSENIARLLRAIHPGLQTELIIIQTTGDRILDRALSRIGDKGLFVTEIEAALVAGTIDLAVHSCKDLPSVTPSELVLAAFPPRADPRDALISASGRRLMELPVHARIGTSSLRRSCQLRSLRPDCTVLNLRGNVDTRLRKAASGDYDAIILAAAGLARLDRSEVVTEFLPPHLMLPAVAQGALAVECRAADEHTRSLLVALDDANTRVAVVAERAFLARLEGGCQVPMAAYATLDSSATTLTMHGLIGKTDGTVLIRGDITGPAAGGRALGIQLAEDLLARGGRAILSLLSTVVSAIDVPEESR